MGNVSGREDEAAHESYERRNEKDDDDEEEEEEEEEIEMEYAHGGAQVHYGVNASFQESMVQSPPHSPHRAFHSTLIFFPQVPMVPLQKPGEMAQNQAIEYADLPIGNRIPTMITWSYDGNQVAVEGSWDNWKTREFLQRTSKDFTIIKLLASGVYHYRFVIDGHYRYDPDLPQERDDRGNVFNILDLQEEYDWLNLAQEHVPEVLNDTCMSEDPSSPVSSYNSCPFSLEDFNEKLPELPPLLRKTPLHQPSSSSTDSTEGLEKPLPAVLNHLYIQKGQTGQSMVALGSTHRFRRKYVTMVLYKSLRNPKK